ncbi:hypothetical protein, partial [Ralstonia pseudosolanacearum]|uniref:hypothetical protein n=1 Tax=Ralstonia pseudosolanacearum TaxID=1310165 RepID=UPI003CF0B231
MGASVVVIMVNMLISAPHPTFDTHQERPHKNPRGDAAPAARHPAGRFDSVFLATADGTVTAVSPYREG